jgi:hypothetical protein
MLDVVWFLISEELLNQILTFCFVFDGIANPILKLIIWIYKTSNFGHFHK